MKDNKDFVTDPIFKELRKFAAAEKQRLHSEKIPANLINEFRNAALTPKRKLARKRITTGIFALVFAGIALPSLSYANVLPTPISNAVKQVVHFVSTPVRTIAELINAPQNDQAQSGNESPENIDNKVLSDSNTASASNSPSNGTSGLTGPALTQPQLNGLINSPNQGLPSQANPAATAAAGNGLNGLAKANSAQSNKTSSADKKTEIKKIETSTAQSETQTVTESNKKSEPKKDEKVDPKTNQSPTAQPSPNNSISPVPTPSVSANGSPTPSSTSGKEKQGESSKTDSNGKATSGESSRPSPSPSTLSPRPTPTPTPSTKK